MIETPGAETWETLTHSAYPARARTCPHALLIRCASAE
jgi:hypothetical protein